jgi:hypothetical protein
MRRLAVALPLAAFFVVATATAALAHYVYERNYVWEDGQGKCVSDYSEISHGDGEGYSRTEADTSRAVTWPVEVHCSRSWDRPINYLKVQNALWKWSSADGWYECTRTNAKFNGSSTSHLEQAKTWSTPCGNGTYGNYGGAWTLFDGAWRGGWLWSGQHQLPA